MDLGQRYMRDFVSMLFPYAAWYDFWRMRKVCVLWWKESEKSQHHWHTWLIHRAPKRKGGTNGLEPVILKTVPLNRQVMRIALKKARKKHAAILARLVKETRDAEQRIAGNRAYLVRETSELRMIEHVQEQYPERRKRTRIEINISNP
jgi:hypothetical protein